MSNLTGSTARRRLYENLDFIQYKIWLHKKCAEILKSYLNGEVYIFHIKSAPASLTEYDTVLIGGSIYMGKIQKEITRFCKHNTKQLLQKSWGYLRAVIRPTGPMDFLKHFSQKSCCAMPSM